MKLPTQTSAKKQKMGARINEATSLWSRWIDARRVDGRKTRG
jgi:hypothetical protein